MWKRLIFMPLPPLPLPFVVQLQVAISPTNMEAVNVNRFHIPSCGDNGCLKMVVFGLWSLVQISMVGIWAGEVGIGKRTRPDTRPIPVADGWTGAEMRVFTLSNSLITDGLTDERTDGRTKPLLELHVRN